MDRRRVFALLAGLPLGRALPLLAQPAQICTEEQHSAWLNSILRQILEFKPGTMRSALEGVMELDGGLSTTTDAIYVWKACPIIKVRAGFNSVSGLRSGKPYSAKDGEPPDRIASISTPYLEYPNLD